MDSWIERKKGRKKERDRRKGWIYVLMDRWCSDVRSANDPGWIHPRSSRSHHQHQTIPWYGFMNRQKGGKRWRSEEGMDVWADGQMDVLVLERQNCTTFIFISLNHILSFSSLFSFSASLFASRSWSHFGFGLGLPFRSLVCWLHSCWAVHGWAPVPHTRWPRTPRVDAESSWSSHPPIPHWQGIATHPTSQSSRKVWLFDHHKSRSEAMKFSFPSAPLLASHSFVLISLISGLHFATFSSAFFSPSYAFLSCSGSLVLPLLFLILPILLAQQLLLRRLLPPPLQRIMAMAARAGVRVARVLFKSFFMFPLDIFDGRLPVKLAWNRLSTSIPPKLFASWLFRQSMHLQKEAVATALLSQLVSGLGMGGVGWVRNVPSFWIYFAGCCNTTQINGCLPVRDFVIPSFSIICHLRSGSDHLVRVNHTDPWLLTLSFLSLFSSSLTLLCIKDFSLVLLFSCLIGCLAPCRVNCVSSSFLVQTVLFLCSWQEEGEEGQPCVEYQCESRIDEGKSCEEQEGTQKEDGRGLREEDGEEGKERRMRRMRNRARERKK